MCSFDNSFVLFSCLHLSRFHPKFMISLIETTLVQYDLLFQYNFPIRQILEPLYLNIILLEKIDAIFFCRNDQVPFKRCANVRLCNCATMQLCNRSILQLCDCATPRLFNCAIVQGPFLAGAKIGACRPALVRIQSVQKSKLASWHRLADPFLVKPENTW